MKHIKNKSEAIFDTEGLEERQKMKQVQALVKKNLSKRENKKSYVIGKKAAPTKYGKNSRTHKLVDSRLRKDVRGQKRADFKRLGKRKAQKMHRKVKPKK